MALLLRLNAKSHSSSLDSNIVPLYTIDNPSIKNYQVIFGHWSALNGETFNSKAINLDTGCVWGNKLTGIRVSDRELFSVPSSLNIPKNRNP